MLAYAGKGKIASEEFNLTELVDGMVHLVSASLSNQCHIECHLDPSIPQVIGDPTQIQQVVMNLLLNAAEAIGENQGRIHVRTGKVYCDPKNFPHAYHVENLKEGDYLCVEVRDNGEGMNEETQERIFEPFYSTKFTGRGLGLAAVLGILKAHQGFIQVESRPGAGSVFRIYLPVSGNAE